jgi:hypothetical protein
MTVMKDGKGGTMAIAALGPENHGHIRGLVRRIEINSQLWITVETTTGRSVVV